VTALCTSGPGRPPALGILSPREDQHHGRAQGRVTYGDGASATLDTDLPRQIRRLSQGRV